jgi:hypothetical protein
MPGRTSPPLDHLDKKPRRVTVGLYLDDDLAVIHDRAVADLEQERTRLEASRPRRIAEIAATGQPDIDIRGLVEAEDAQGLRPLQDAVTAALADLDDATVWFTFQSLGRRAFADLVARHPPAEEDHDAAGRMGGQAAYNLETLAPELVLLSCVRPVLSPALVERIFDGGEFNEAEIAQLAAAALDANTQARRVTHRPAPIPGRDRP